MLDTHVKFHSSNGKRLILVVDDEFINRAMLGEILHHSYEILTASSGAEALALIRSNQDILSLILLDLILPDIHGLDILRKVKEDPQLNRIPVIVMTSDRDSEVESLTLGAIDFIPKPYPMPEVVQARVLRTIELSEDRDILRWTERDQLTGLYNREFFYRYAAQFDLHHKDLAMDAIILDINHFHILNERHGKTFGDELLRRVGEKVREMVQEEGGIVCRREADTFLIYCPHRSDYSQILEEASAYVADTPGLGSRVRLRMGVYSEVDKTIDIERRFDRAKMAADTVKSSFTKAVAIYDNTLHESEIFAQQLLDGFQTALEEKQFLVYYQPKYDIRSDNPVLASAEALVRWQHPQLGLISPGIFIPLLEDNGLIQDMDEYVWREAAAQIGKWKQSLGTAIPVSVNVSRVDMYDPDLVEKIHGLIQEFQISTDELLLEITESAYTQDSGQIIRTVTRLRDLGFCIEMDDFGTGYSSLNMISTLPIDALKLDMQFIRNAFGARKDTRMLEVVLEIADSLGVPTIAEGVETAEQMLALKAMGCDIVQGYYFSKPVPPAEFEPFLLEQRQERIDSSMQLRQTRPWRAQKGHHGVYHSAHDKFTYDALHDPQTGLYNHSAFHILLQDADQNHIAVLIADIDDYKALVANYGREAQDLAIREVASLLRKNFRSVDAVCRIRRDEFAVIMTRVSSELKEVILAKLHHLNDLLALPQGSVPPLSLCIGMAFADRGKPEGDLFQDADTALAMAKERGKGEIVVYEMP